MAATCAAQGATRPGCVLPATDAPAPVAAPAPPPEAPVYSEGKGFSAWVPLLALAALAAAAFLLLDDDDDDDDVQLSRG